MRQSIFIRRLFATVLLFLFVLSNMPRQVLHGMFANHKDSCQQTAKNDSNNPQLQKASIHCQCLNLVVENPFVDNDANIDFLSPIRFSEKSLSYSDAFYSSGKSLVSLRGPPSLT